MIKRKVIVLLFFMFVFSYWTHAATMTKLLDLKIEERASNVKKENVWKEIPFKLPYAAKVRVTVVATARDNGHANDDDLKWGINSEDFNWGTAKAWDGRDLRGKKKEVIVEKSMLPGSHKLLFWADARPTLHTVKIEMELKEEIKGPILKEYTYIKNIGVKIVWQQVDRVQKYIVFRKEKNEKNYKRLAEVGVPFYMDAFIEDGKTYDYKIGVGDSNGNVFAYSKEFRVELVEKLKVSMPKGLGVESRNEKAILNWNSVAEDELSMYNVYRKKSDGAGFEKIGDTKETTYEDTGLKEGDEYFYSISAVDKDENETDRTEPVKVKIQGTVFDPKGVHSVFPEKLYPGQKAVVYFSPKRSKEIKKARMRMRRRDPDLPLLPEHIYLRYGWNSWDPKYLTPENESPEMVYDPETKYLKAEIEIPFYAKQMDFVFFDEDGNYDKNWSKDYQYDIEKDTIAPGPPRNLKATEKNKMIYLEWDAPEDLDVSGYDVFRSENKNIGWTSPNSMLARSLSNKSYRDTNVESDKVYYYRVLAWDFSGNQGDMSEPIEASPKAEGILLNDACVWEPENPTIGDVIKFYYVPEKGELENPEEVKIKIGVNNWDTSTIPTIQRPMKFDKIYGAWYYEYSIENDTKFVNVAFTDGEEWDTQSGLNWNVRVYPDSTPPDPVTGFDGKSISMTEIELSWNANKEKDLAGYHIYRNDKRINRKMVTETSFIDNYSIEEGTYYQYSIVAVDKVGNESISTQKEILSSRDEITVPIFDFTASISSKKPIKLIATTDVSYNWKMDIMHEKTGDVVRSVTGVSDNISFMWDLRNEQGEYVKPGKYIYKVSIVSEPGILPRSAPITVIN